jgi:hypothetical protein
MFFSKIPSFSYPKHCFFPSLISYEHVSFFGLLIICIFHFQNMVFLTNNLVLPATVYSFQLHTKSYILTSAFCIFPPMGRYLLWACSGVKAAFVPFPNDAMSIPINFAVMCSWFPSISSCNMPILGGHLVPNVTRLLVVM